jgi:hypothetical protein
MRSADDSMGTLDEAGQLHGYLERILPDTSRDVSGIAVSKAQLLPRETMDIFAGPTSGSVMGHS